MTIFIYKWSRNHQFFQDDDYVVAIGGVGGEIYFHGAVNWGS